jgi:parvulin-like peptidyl-prolyl isomerase
MKSPVRRRLLPAVVLLVAAGCSQPEETTTAATPGASPATAATPGAAGGLGGDPSAAQTPLTPETLPEVVARVNRYEVARNDLVQAVGEAQSQWAQRGQPQQPTLTFVRGVLDHIIDQILLEQDGDAAGATAPAAEVEQQLAAMRARAPTPQQFAMFMEQRGVTEEKLREQIRRKLTVERHLTQMLVRKPIEDAEAWAFYEQNPDMMKTPERRHLRHILVRSDPKAPQADQTAAQKKAEGILARLRKGEDFAKLALETSDDPMSKSRGGDLSWVMRGQTVPPFEQAAFALENVNDVSAVVQSDSGYHIIQMVAIEPEGTVDFETAKPKIVAWLQQKSVQEQVAAKVKALRQKAKVKTFI